MRSPLISKIYGFIWLGLALAGFAYIIYSNLQFNACCKGKTSDMAVGFETIFIGLPALMALGLALTLLLAKTKHIKRIAVIILSVIPSILFIAEPLIGCVLIAVMAFVLYSMSDAKQLK
jgi:phosphoglycerol transferase MdoB-like AlkP superfamily enzyme